jgi:predicted dehydrogenase
MGSINDPIGVLQPPSSAYERPLPNPTPAAVTISSLLPSSVAAPPSTPPVASPPRFLIIGAGSRGNAYARSVTRTTRGLITAVAEPEAFQRDELGKKYIWGRQRRDSPAPGEAFVSWQEWLDYEVDRREKESRGERVERGVDGVFVCTLDEMHREIVVGIAEKGIKVHVLCEKPLATSWKDCLAIWKAMRDCGKVFGIGHVLRYSPHNMILRKLLLEEKVIGDILSIEHTEPVGWWHYSHSYVRYVFPSTINFQLYSNIDEL